MATCNHLATFLNGTSIGLMGVGLFNLNPVLTSLGLLVFLLTFANGFVWKRSDAWHKGCL